MCEKLPVSDFKWAGEEEVSKIEWNLWNEKPIPACILEVDLTYPEYLHDFHNDYPLAPERLKIGKVDKLVPNLMNKERYVVHHKLLRYYMSMGLRLERVRRVILFEERDIMSGYINLNTRMRMQGKSKFEKDFYKLMNNSLFGKTMENIRNRVDMSFVTSESQLLKKTRKPNYVRNTVFSKTLAAVHMQRVRVKFNKPVYLGFSILELSKLIMYDFHYNFIRVGYGDRARLLFTDTDSLCYEIFTEDFYEDVNPYVETHFDTSDVKEHPTIKVGINKKVLGMMKCETNCEEISEFVGLRSKLYAIRVPAREALSSVKCKGIKKSVIKKTISLDDMKKVLYNDTIQSRKMGTIRSNKHTLYTQVVSKVALSANDDKRHILPDKVNTLAIGHYRIH